MSHPHAVSILMYHSLSEGDGPTCIAPEVFRRQMQALEECGYQVVGLADLDGWLRGERSLPSRAVVLTFDDGFEDFATVAYPELAARGWSATVFLPSEKVGGLADWDAEGPRRRLMSWDTVRELARWGIDFGAHGARHANLTALAPEDARAEVVRSGEVIREQIGRPALSFAAPFGRTNAAVRAEVARHYRLAVGTVLGQARRDSDPFDLPRIEMWYFRDPARWRAYLRGARAYLTFRRALRWARVQWCVVRDQGGRRARNAKQRAPLTPDP